MEKGVATHSSILAWRIPWIGSLVCYSPWGYKGLDMIKQLTLGFPGGSDGRASAWNVGHPSSIPGLGRSPGEGNGCPLQYSCLENPIGYSPWGHKELDMTK